MAEDAFESRPEGRKLIVNGIVNIKKDTAHIIVP
jgi:hypothetical protein